MRVLYRLGIFALAVGVAFTSFADEIGSIGHRETIYRADAPLNAEMRLRLGDSRDIIVELLSAAPDSAGAGTASICPVFAQGRFRGETLRAPLDDPAHPAYDLSLVEGDSHNAFIAIEQIDDALLVEGRADYCGLGAGFAGTFRPIEPDRAILLSNCAPDTKPPVPCWADKDAGGQR